MDKYMYFLSLPFKIGGDLRDDGVNLLDDGVANSNAGRSSMTTITHIALLLWFEIGIWPPPLPPLPDFSPEIKKSPQTIHVIYFWNALGMRDPMAMFWGVRHANTQRQRQRQRQIHLGPEVESHYRPYMCYIFGKPWVQGPL